MVVPVHADTAPVDPKLCGMYRGQRVAIIATGPSLLDESSVEVTRRFRYIIGVNDSFLFCPPTFQVALDKRWFDEYEEDLRGYANKSALFTSISRPFGIGIQPLNPPPGRTVAWSWDISIGVYCRSTTYVALQIAVYLGFSAIYFLGLDLCNDRYGRGHFSEPRELALNQEPLQREIFGFAAGVLDSYPVKIRNCSPISRLRAFPYVPLKDVEVVK